MNIILFDNNCNLCRKIVRFIKNRDNEQKTCFINLGSKEAQEKLNNLHFISNKESLIFIQNKLVYTYSTAVLKICKELGGIYSASYCLIIIPKKIRDFLYKILAKYRYRLF